MKNLHKIGPQYTEEQLACMWWCESHNYNYNLVDGRLQVINLKFKSLPFTEVDVKICLNAWDRAGRPSFAITKLEK